MPTSIAAPEVQSVFDQAQTPRRRRVSVAGRTVEVVTPFPSPADWRDQWIYFLLIDRFCNPNSPPRVAPFDGQHDVFQGGTFNGVRERLDYLQQLGVGALWLSPVLKNCQFHASTYHGYGIQDFLQVDARFASDPRAARENPQLAEDELRALVDEAHARGIYVILDIVLNHTGDVFEYVLRDVGSAEADWQDSPYTIRWRDENGRGRTDWSAPPDQPARDAAVWPAELQRNELFRRQGRGGEAGGDFASLKELDTGLRETTEADGRHYPVRKALIRAYQYLIAKYDVDGFRIDTLKYIEPEFAQVFGNAVREYALTIGKKNFFTFGEVYDNEEQIARFIGRNAAEEGDLMGVDAALDFPLFFKLPSVLKGQLPPAEVVALFRHRKAVEREVISSHGEASRYFVTFLDNHDQTARFHFRSPDAPERFGDQLTLGLGVLFALQGIPCVYYGTEQGLHGRGERDLAVREALWGKVDAFNRAHPVYSILERLASTRREQAPMRYGRQYFRPISGDGVHFGISTVPGGVLAFSRILNEQEIVVLANSQTESGWRGEVIVDTSLNRVGAKYELLFSNRTPRRDRAETVIEKSADRVEIHEADGTVTRGPARALRLAAEEMEIGIWGQIRE